MECAAITDVCRVLEIGDSGWLAKADELQLSIVRMLSKVCR